MDWTEKLEHKKKLRKMAYRMAWADFKDFVLGWKGLLVFLTYFGFFLMPYVKTEQYNFAGMYYFATWCVIAINAIAETSFNYLPLSTKDIVYYLKCRTNFQIAWVVLLSVLSGIILSGFRQEVFWERGLVILIFMLVTVEFMFFVTLQSYSKPNKVSFFDALIPKGRKIRVIFYYVYELALLFACMFIGMFMKDNENATKKLLVLLCLYLVMYIFRADAAGWVRFDEFNKAPRESMWGNVETLNQ